MVKGVDRDGDDTKGKSVERTTPLEHVICT